MMVCHGSGRGNVMNEKKIAFIICTNSEIWFEECKKYIEILDIPQGFNKEVIKIVGAESMAKGYNEGMHKSNAKYKVYLHQDVFITKKDFLMRMLNIFIDNPEIGLLGVIGSNEIVKHGAYWNEWNIGQLYACSGLSAMFLHSENKLEGDYANAVAVDGMLMMTQYDVQWREDLFKKWDFYDISQCFEFQRVGYRIGVMLEKGLETSTFHDCGHSKLLNYNEWRRVFCKEYAEFGFEADARDTNNAEEASELINQLTQKVDKLMQNNLENAALVVDKSYEIWPVDNTLIMMKNIFEIYKTEKNNQCKRCFVKLGDKYEDLAKKYIQYKFLLRELEFDIDENTLLILYEELKELNVSIYALECIMLRSCYDVEKVESKLFSLFE